MAITRSVRGTVRVDGRAVPKPVDVAAPQGASTIEGRDPRRDPRPGDVVEDEASAIEVLRVGEATSIGEEEAKRLLAPGERWDPEGTRAVEGRRYGWRARVRGEAERPPEDRGWVLASWRANMEPARVVRVATE